MSKASVILAFSLGAVAGAIVSWKVLDKKYEKLFKDEIDDYKERLTNRYSGPNQSEPSTEDDETELGETERQAEIRAYAEEVARLGYASNDEKEVPEVAKKPYVIPPEDFGEDDNYDTESLTLYADGVLTDDYGNVITDIEGLVGEDSLTHFGEYEDDSVFVRNEKFKCDYEILQDTRTYIEANQTTVSMDYRRES